MKKEFRAIARGHVQMVNYRHFTSREAKKLELVGTVCNLPDGSVEIVAEGEEENLLQFIEKLKRGPFFARVRDLEVIWAPEALGKFDTFYITDATY
jgi:acylphosphatase